MRCFTILSTVEENVNTFYQKNEGKMNFILYPILLPKLTVVTIHYSWLLKKSFLFFASIFLLVRNKSFKISVFSWKAKIVHHN